MALYRIDGNAPEVPASAYVAAEATLIGRVTLGERASVWSGAIARGDNEPIRIGTESERAGRRGAARRPGLSARHRRRA